MGAGGAQLASADGAFVVRLRAYVHQDGRFFLGDAPIGTNTFILRRVRPILEGTLARNYDFRVMTDFGGGTVSLQEAYVDARVSPAFRVRVGKYKEPFGLERLQSATAIEFVERSFPTNLAPNRDLGLQLWGDVHGGVVSWAAGVFNGVVDGGSGDVDVDEGKDVAARVFFQPLRTTTIPVLKGLGFGLAVTTGNQNGTVAAPNLASYRSPAQQVVFSYRSNGAVATTTIADGRRTRWSPQADLYTGPLGALAEYVTVTQRVRRDATTADLTTTAGQVAATFALTGEPASYAGLRPRNPFAPSRGTWGALELAARVSALDFDQDAFPTFAVPTSAVQNARAWAVGINWYLNQNVKVVVDYEQTRFTGGVATGDRADERSLLSRVQLSF